MYFLFAYRDALKVNALLDGLVLKGGRVGLADWQHCKLSRRYLPKNVWQTMR